MKLIGPFEQIVTLENLPLKGKINDEQLEIIQNGGVLIENGKIFKVDDYQLLISEYPLAQLEIIKDKQVLLPAWVDSHTHIAFGGSRARDFAMRLNGKTYLEIAESGGGIWSTVTETRKLRLEELVEITSVRVKKLIEKGITTIEIKSGYGLNVEEELKLMHAIKQVKDKFKIRIIPTFLGAHMKPKDFDGSNLDYLNILVEEVFPILKSEDLTNRIDIFVEKSAFTIEEGEYYLTEAKKTGFDITVHADQFTSGSAKLAVKFGAISADHLESTSEEDIPVLAGSETVATVLPGASIGLGMQYSPARKLLDAGACLSIASDWNPGSAPMGDLLTQASVLAAFEKLSVTEILAAITFRAARALNIDDLGRISEGYYADFIAFPVSDFSEIIYQQGQLKPVGVWSFGNKFI